MKTSGSLWFPIAVASLTACSAASDPNGFYDDDDEWAEEEAEGVDVGEAPPGALGAGGSGSSAGGEAGAPGDPLPDTIVGTVCYPGPTGASDACVPLVDWSSSWGSAYAYPSHSSNQYRKPLRFVDLGAADSNLGIAKNFILGEVLQEWKGRYGVFQPHVVDKLQQIRNTSGGAIHINSGYRSPGYNRSVDGATYSRHMFGDAVDMRSSVMSLSGIRSICQQLNAGYIGMYSTFVHCDWRNHALDAKFFSSGTVSLGGADEIESIMPVHTAELVLADDAVAWTAPATGFDEGEPLRTWTAYDSAGNELQTVDAAEYEPPADAVRIHVEIGGNVELDLEL